MKRTSPIPDRRIVCALLLLFCVEASRAAGPERAAVLERMEASSRAGTGGPTVEFARCNPDAVVDFYDGHHTPGLISDAHAWSYAVLVEDAETPRGISERGATQIAAARNELLDRRDKFRAGSMARAKRIAATKEEREASKLRRETQESSNRAAQEADALAERLVRDLKRTLSKEDRAVFARWLETKKRTAVILRMDYTKVTNWDCPRR